MGSRKIDAWQWRYEVNLDSASAIGCITVGIYSSDNAHTFRVNRRELQELRTAKRSERDSNLDPVSLGSSTKTK